jgi:N-acetylglucosamine malate deacetylase 1
MSGQTLLVGLAHPDDELGAAGTILAHRARGDRVVVVWLSRGEMTEAFGPLSTSEVARRRTAQGRRAGEILGVETRFLDHPDTGIQATPEAASGVAKLIAELRPDALLTWGHAWIRGMRHPDHQATGALFRDAVTLARIGKVVSPLRPHRGDVPVFTLRDLHDPLPEVVVDVEPYLAGIRELAGFYHREVGFGDPAWLEARLSRLGALHGLRYAETFSAWETRGGRCEALLPASPLEYDAHPDVRQVMDRAAGPG